MQREALITTLWNMPIVKPFLILYFLLVYLIPIFCIFTFFYSQWGVKRPWFKNIMPSSRNDSELCKIKIASTKHYTQDDRKCLSCGYEGKMMTWLSNYTSPILILLVLIYLFIIPGIVFLIWCSGKFKCPSCGKLGKNSKLSLQLIDTKKCPYCAETIKQEAIVCRFCSNKLAETFE